MLGILDILGIPGILGRPILGILSIMVYIRAWPGGGAAVGAARSASRCRPRLFTSRRASGVRTCTWGTLPPSLHLPENIGLDRHPPAHPTLVDATTTTSCYSQHCPPTTTSHGRLKGKYTAFGTSLGRRCLACTGKGNLTESLDVH